MAKNKQVLLIFADIDTDAIVKSEVANIVKATTKGASAKLEYKDDYKKEAGSGTVPASANMLWDAVKENDFKVGEMAYDTDFSLVETSSLEDLDAQLEKIYDLGSKKSLVVIATKDKVFFQGNGIERNAELGTVQAASLAPTIAYIADFPFPADVSAPLIYKVLKGLNFKMKEIQNMQKSVDAMNKALDRNDKNSSWRKHDCA